MPVWLRSPPSSLDICQGCRDDNQWSTQVVLWNLYVPDGTRVTVWASSTGKLLMPFL
jgi:hypothetical protein